MNPYGNGIGLSICKRICDNLNGNISVKSIPNKGSSFVFAMQVFNTPKAFVDHSQIEIEEEKLVEI